MILSLLLAACGGEERDASPIDVGVEVTTTDSSGSARDTASTDAEASDTVTVADTAPAVDTTPNFDAIDPLVDLDMTAADFDCILDWPKVRRFRITNKLGYLNETLAIANSPDGGVYPVGTVIQLVPQEAMVKRRAGWNPETNDWEFFSLEVLTQEASILARGAADTFNQFGGNCFECHALAAPQWDLVCEQDHGCTPLPFSESVITRIQEDDPRCGD